MHESGELRLARGPAKVITRQLPQVTPPPPADRPWLGALDARRSDHP
jgi:hypothetical protein